MKKYFSKNLNRQFHSVNRRGTPLLSLLVLAACGGGRDTSSGRLVPHRYDILSGCSDKGTA